MAQTETPDLDALRSKYVDAIKAGSRAETTSLAPLLSISTEEMETHFAAAHHADDDWEPEHFEDFEALPPGRFDPRVFDQTIWWVDMLRRPHLITDTNAFPDNHLVSVIRFIRVEGWRWIDAPDMDSAEAFTMESFRSALTRTIDATPLMQALVAEAHRRNLSV